jgi:TRAP-type uncharacterized transport system, periplasmic component
VVLVPVSGDDQDAVLDAAPFYAADTIPAGTYSGVDSDTPTVSVQAMIATREGLDAGVVEDITSALFDNLDQLTIKTDFISVESAQDGMSIELHPGAAAYFG